MSHPVITKTLWVILSAVKNSRVINTNSSARSGEWERNIPASTTAAENTHLRLI